MGPSAIRQRVAEYYAGKLHEHGPTPRGVDWNSAHSQALRFRKLLQIREGEPSFSINDYGCGYGALAAHLAAEGARFTYCGFDIAEAMVTCARERHAQIPECSFVSEEGQLGLADYTVASGIFNVKLDTTDEAWHTCVLDTLERLAALSRHGFAFNALTLYSDPGKRRADLYYMDPREIFDHCKRTFSPLVALLHDYPLFEFTVLVRKTEIS